MTHEEQQTLVLPDGAAAAQETQQEQHGPHGQDDVDPGEEQGVDCHDLPEAHRVHQNPNADTQQEGAAQLRERTKMFISDEFSWKMKQKPGARDESWGQNQLVSGILSHIFSG